MALPKLLHEQVTVTSHAARSQHKLTPQVNTTSHQPTHLWEGLGCTTMGSIQLKVLGHWIFPCSLTSGFCTKLPLSKLNLSFVSAAGLIAKTLGSSFRFRILSHASVLNLLCKCLQIKLRSHGALQILIEFLLRKHSFVVNLSTAFLV